MCAVFASAADAQKRRATDQEIALRSNTAQSCSVEVNASEEVWASGLQSDGHAVKSGVAQYTDWRLQYSNRRHVGVTGGVQQYTLQG